MPNGMHTPLAQSWLTAIEETEEKDEDGKKCVQTTETDHSSERKEWEIVASMYALCVRRYDIFGGFYWHSPIERSASERNETKKTIKWNKV